MESVAEQFGYQPHYYPGLSAEEQEQLDFERDLWMRLWSLQIRYRRIGKIPLPPCDEP